MPMMSGETILSIISLVIGLLGLVAGYIFYQKAKKEKQPCFTMKTNKLIENRHPQFNGLEIIYKGQVVHNVSASHIAFWNSGRETISFNDIDTSEPLRITANNQTEILDVEVLMTNNPANQIRSAQQPHTKDYKVVFDYLDKDHGAIIQVIHTGTTSQDIDVTGHIKGVRSIERKELYSRSDLIRSIGRHIVAAIGIAVVVLAIQVLVTLGVIPLIPSLLGIIGGAALVAMVIIYVTVLRRLYMVSKLPPRKLDPHF